jgi:hypothetical protein
VLRAKGGTAWHLPGRNENHGIAQQENADYKLWSSLLIWKQTLLAEHP